MSPSSNVKLDSLAVFAAAVMYSILEGKLDEIASFLFPPASIGGGGWPVRSQWRLILRLTSAWH
jgi:hypothetical protein